MLTLEHHSLRLSRAMQTVFGPRLASRLRRRAPYCPSIKSAELGRHPSVTAAFLRHQLTTQATMSTDIVLPTLSRWAEQHITALFQATNEDDFNSAYDAFFTKNPHIVVNGKHISTSDYRKQLLQGKFAESGAQVAFTGAVEVPTDSSKPVDVSELKNLP